MTFRLIGYYFKMENELPIMFKISNPTFNLKSVNVFLKFYSTKKPKQIHHDFNLRIVCRNSLQASQQNLLARISISVKRNANIDI